ncbi:MAG: alkaline phosphatase family protein [Mycobacteriales bacterium]
MTGSDGVSRRAFLGGLGAAAAAVAGDAVLGASTTAGASTARPSAALPEPADSGIDHIIVVMMENRSFDHYLGWVPGADGRQKGLSYVGRDWRRRSTHHLRDTQGCAHPDPDHSYEGGRIQLNGGACDGWLLSGENDDYAIGYYTGADLSFYGKAAPYWTVCDRYFSATMAQTYPNRLYQHSAQTDRISNTTATATMPTIWDRLADAGVSGTYYYGDVPFLALYGTKYVGISRPYPEFLAAAAAGTLPAVSFVDPRFTDEASGTSADDHPHADIRAGQAFLSQIYGAVTRGPGWGRTLLVVNYDEWGGFYDHVVPGTAPDARPDLGTGLRGFRVPCLVVSPRARRRHVAHGVYDHTSVLKAIEWRWGLKPLTVRDSAANNLAAVLDFATPPKLAAPSIDVPPFVGQPCDPATPADYEEWRALARQARTHGFAMP